MHYGHGRGRPHYGRRRNPEDEIASVIMNTWGCFDPTTLERLSKSPGQRLYIIRGLPGAGKSTLAEKMAAHVNSADDYFMHGDEYRFDPSKLGEAHADCQRKTQRALSTGEDVAVANTFTQRWEIEPYLKLAADAGCCVCVVNVFDGGLSDDELAERNTHGVPLEAIEAMRARYEDDWQNGDPRPPWTRGGSRASNPSHSYEVYYGGNSIYRGPLRDTAMKKFMSHHNRPGGEATFSVDDEVLYRGGGGGHVRLKNPPVAPYIADEYDKFIEETTDDDDDDSGDYADYDFHARLKNPRVQGYRADETGSSFDDYDDFEF
jgi:predicted kinase